MTLTLRFGVAYHGWLPLTFTSARTSFTCTISHVLDDPLLALVQASIGFLKGTDQEVMLFEEPQVHRLVFQTHRVSDELVIRQFPDYRQQVDEKGVLVFSVIAPRWIIVRVLWRGLRELQSRIVHEQFKTHWNHPFPQRELEQLTVYLNQFEAV